MKEAGAPKYLQAEKEDQILLKLKAQASKPPAEKRAGKVKCQAFR